MMGVRKSRACVFAALVVSGLSISNLAQTNTEFQHGVAEFQAGDYASAATSFARAESLSPTTTEALLFEGKCLIHLDNFAGAEKALRAYIVAHDKSADALYLLGFVLHRLNRPAESLTAYTQAAALVQPTGDDLKIVGLDYVLLDDYPDAIKWLEKAVEFDPKNADAWYYLGRAYYTKGRLAEARTSFNKVLNLEPHDVRAENNLGLILETEGKPTEAIEAYRRSIKWQGQSLRPSEQPYVNLGNLLMEQGQTKEALEPLQKAVEVAPNNGYCRLKLGVYYRKIGQLERAQQELEKATELDPNNAAAHYQLGRLYKETGAVDRAQTEFNRAAELETRAAGSKPLPSER